ncbi:MAG: 30S ribosomal protein S19 [Candidatus Thorarchaeota archaeon]|nr:MAG: 30S ribosomal protein S19 [Candidatus Thorarchaeota archaeon]
MSQKAEPMYRGYPLSELVKMNMDTLIELLPTRRRRTLKRGLPSRQKKLLMKLRNARRQIKKGKDVVVKTHCRDMVILPEMVDLTIGVHNGKEFQRVKIIPQMIGHMLGEFAITTRQVKHGNPGLGATKSSAYVPLK